MKRRTLIRDIGTGIAIFGASAGTASGNENMGTQEFKRVVEKAAVIEDTHGLKAKKEYLDDHDISYTSKEASKPISLGSDSKESVTSERGRKTSSRGQNESNSTADPGNDIQVQQIQDPQSGGITVSMRTICAPPRDNYTNVGVEISIDYDFKATCHQGTGQWQHVSYGEDPKDAAAIIWNSLQNEYYELIDGGGESAVYSYSNVSWDRDLHQPAKGRTAFRFDDHQVYHDWGGSPDDLGDSCGSDGLTTENSATVKGGTCGVFLKPIGDYPNRSRPVRANYTHAHGSLDINPGVGWSASGPAIMFTPKYRINQDMVVTDENDDDLLIRPR